MILKDMKIKTLKIIFCILVFLLIENHKAFAEISGDKESLRLIAMSYKNNQNQITSWQGKARISDLITNRKYKNIDFDERTSKSKVEFVYDEQLNAARWNWEELSDGFKSGDKKYNIPKLYIQNTIMKDHRAYKHGPIFYNENSSEKVERPSRLIVRSALAEKPEMLSSDFHPMHYFKMVEENLVQRLMFYYNNANKDNITGNIKRDGSIIIFERNAGDVVNRYTFDLDKGGNLVAYLGDDSLISEMWEFDYKEKNGAFVPSNVKYKNVRKNENQTYQREVKFTESVVNEDVSPSEFELEKIGILPGDMIVDDLAGLRYKYKSKSNRMSDIFNQPLVDSDKNSLKDVEKIELDINDQSRTSDKEISATEKTSKTQESQEVKKEQYRRTNPIYVFLLSIILVVIFVSTIMVFCRRKKDE